MECLLTSNQNLEFAKLTTLVFKNNNRYIYFQKVNWIYLLQDTQCVALKTWAHGFIYLHFKSFWQCPLCLDYDKVVFTLDLL